MQIHLPNGGIVTLSKSNFKQSGGEGSVYIKGDVAYKIYHEPSKCIPLGKVQELSHIKNTRVITPLDILKDAKGNYIGYSMKYLTDKLLLCQSFPKSFKMKNNLDQNDILAMVKSLEDLVDSIHKASCLIVDLNENNFMFDLSSKEVFAIDTDSYQTKTFKATAIMPNIRDPHCGINFTNETDWYSFAILACQLWLGIHPFKGTHPSLNGFEARMAANVSIFNKEVTVPKIVPSFDTIPNLYKDWMINIFEKKERSAPPTGNLKISTTKANVIELKGDQFIDISIVSSYSDNINSAYSLEGNYIVSTSEPLYHLKCRDNLIIGTKLVPEGIEYKHPITLKSTIAKFALKNTMYYQGYLYTMVGESLVQLSLHPNQGIISVKLVANVLEHATQVFEGCYIQNMLGTYFLSVFPKSEYHLQLSLKELTGTRIVTAKFFKYVLVVITERNGVYNKHIYKIKEDHSYIYQETKDITILDTNFTVLDNGIIVYISEEEDLCITHITSNQLKIIKSSLISNNMRLFSNGVKSLAYINNNIIHLSLKK